jgi:hypothetical protein
VRPRASPIRSKAGLGGTPPKARRPAAIRAYLPHPEATPSGYAPLTDLEPGPPPRSGELAGLPGTLLGSGLTPRVASIDGPPGHPSMDRGGQKTGTLHIERRSIQKCLVGERRALGRGSREETAWGRCDIRNRYTTGLPRASSGPDGESRRSTTSEAFSTPYTDGGRTTFTKGHGLGAVFLLVPDEVVVAVWSFPVLFRSVLGPGPAGMPVALLGSGTQEKRGLL